jgi:hypothetical protein
MVRSFAVEAEVQCGAELGRVQLWPLDASAEGEEVGRSRSFSIRLVEGSSPVIRGAARELAGRVQAHDDGTFYAKAERLRSRISTSEAREHHPDGAGFVSLGSPEATAREHGLVDSARRLLGWLALVILLIPLSLAAVRRWWSARDARWWFIGLGALCALAIVVRVVVPPWAPLHANAHGIAELRGLASPSSNWMGPVESDRYGAAWRQLVRGVIQVWNGGATSVFAFSAVLSASAVLLLGLFAYQLTESRAASLVAAAGLAVHPAHVALSPSESPMGFAGMLFLLGLIAACAAPTLQGRLRIFAWWSSGLALAAASELSVVTLLLPVAALLVVAGMQGARLWQERWSWILPALLVAVTMCLHLAALGPILDEAGARRAGPLLQALIVGWKGHRNALLDATLSSPLLLPLALAGIVALALRGTWTRAFGLVAASAILIGGCSVIAVCRTDVIRYQPDGELLLFALAGATVLLAPFRVRSATAGLLGLLFVATSGRGLASVRTPLLDASAWKIIRAAEPELPPAATVHLASRRMAGGMVLNDFPEFLLQARGHRVRLDERPEAANGEGCVVWLGPSCYSFTVDELAQGGLARAIHLGDAALRPECGALVQRIDAAHPPVKAEPISSPFPQDEFFESSGHPLIGLFPCQGESLGAPVAVKPQ